MLEAGAARDGIDPERPPPRALQEITLIALAARQRAEKAQVVLFHAAAEIRYARQRRDAGEQRRETVHAALTAGITLREQCTFAAECVEVGGRAQRCAPRGAARRKDVRRIAA